MHDPLVVARFWSKVDVSNKGTCWTWRAGKGSHGYGVFYPTHGAQCLAHRFALELVSGRQGDEALHSCDNKECVNPHHLRWGTHAENMEEAGQHGLMYAPNANRAACPQGHSMTIENTLIKAKRGTNGRTYETRACRECNRIYLAKRRERRSA